MAINKPIAGQSELRSVNISNGKFTVYGTEKKDWYQYTDSKAADFVDLSAQEIATLDKAIAICGAYAGYEGGDKSKIEDELTTELADLKSATEGVEKI